MPDPKFISDALGAILTVIGLLGNKIRSPKLEEWIRIDTPLKMRHRVVSLVAGIALLIVGTIPFVGIPNTSSTNNNVAAQSTMIPTLVPSATAHVALTAIASPTSAAVATRASLSTSPTSITTPPLASSVSMTVGGFCGGVEHYLPDTIDPLKDPQAAADHVAALIDSGEVDTLPVFPNPIPPEADQSKSPENVETVIENTNENGRWIRIDSNVTAQVQVQKMDLKHVNVFDYNPCGGGEFFADHGNLPLQSGADQYQLRTRTGDFDYFSLQPGESQVFLFGFPCKNVDELFRVSLQVSVTLDNQTSMLNVPGIPKFICPETVTTWFVPPPNYGTPIEREGEWAWDGTKYQWHL